MKIVNFSLEAGNKYFARIDGQRFFVGRRVGYDGGKGLMNVEGTPAQKYDRSLYDFNPTRSEVEDTEVIQSAKLIHWALNDPSHRDLQIRIGVDNFRSKMVDYAVRYRLDGAADTPSILRKSR